MIAIVTGITNVSLRRARSRFSNCPPQVARYRKGASRTSGCFSISARISPCDPSRFLQRCSGRQVCAHPDYRFSELRQKFRTKLGAQRKNEPDNDQSRQPDGYRNTEEAPEYPLISIRQPCDERVVPRPASLAEKERCQNRHQGQGTNQGARERRARGIFVRLALPGQCRNPWKWSKIKEASTVGA